MKYENNFTIENLLFPNISQQEPIKTNPHYKRIVQQNKYRITSILRAIVHYVIDTKRFKIEKFGY